MNDYQAKIQAKRERYADMADKARAESESRYTAARIAADHIPFGQPILVGHHSERADRANRDRIHNNMLKSIEAEKKAAHYASKAETYGTHGISSDNPEAADLLADKVAKLEAERDMMKAVNAAWRKAKRPGAEDLAGWEAVAETVGVNVAQFNDIRAWLARGFHDQPYPSYSLSNIGARIKTAKSRISEVQHKPAESSSTDCGAFELVHNADENRVQIVFPGKPDADTRATLKRYGFRWAPSQGAWQRQLNGNGIYAAEQVRKALS